MKIFKPTPKVIQYADNKTVLARINSAEAEKLHPEQWINVYGISEGQREYLNTCQVSQLDTVLNDIPAHWWESFLLEPLANDGDFPPLFEPDWN